MQGLKVRHYYCMKISCSLSIYVIQEQISSIQLFSFIFSSYANHVYKSRQSDCVNDFYTTNISYYFYIKKRRKGLISQFKHVHGDAYYNSIML